MAYIYLFAKFLCQHFFSVLGEKSEKKKKKEKLIGEIQREESFHLESSNKIPKLDTSQWPLLLKVGFNENNVVSLLTINLY